MSRRARGEVQALVLNYLLKTAPDARVTPYGIAKSVGVTPGSATAAVKALAKQEEIAVYGTSPLIVGRK